ncbi:MAG: class I SAM-dependent methyltransferase [Nanoarchaeota archaeon]
MEKDLGFLYVKKDYKKKAEIISRLIGDIIRRSNNILDVGSGNGLIVGHLEEFYEKKITKLDPLGTQPEILKIDFLDNKFKDGEFDLIIMNGVYDYIKDKDTLLKELHRVGKCVYCTLTVNIPFIAGKIDKWASYKDSEKDFLKRAEKYFRVVDITYRLFGSKTIYFILKKIIAHRKYILHSK